MKPILLFLTALSCFGAQQPPATWQWFSWNGNKYTAHDAATTNFAFPQNSYFPTAAFLTTTVNTNVLGDLTGKTFFANYTVAASPDCVFWFGGQGRFNNGPLPPNTRFFFSTSSATYSLKAAQQNEDAYWFSTNYVMLTNGTFFLITTIDPTTFSNAQGHTGTEHSAAFSAAVANVRQAGLCYGGGSFSDVGCSVSPGTATFQLNSLLAQ